MNKKDKQKIIIDTDAGHDDALAMMLLLKPGLFDVQVITTVAGNSTIENVTRNAAFILELLGRSEVPLYSGDSQPLKRVLIQAAVHGESGLDGVDKSNTVYRLTNNAPEKIIELVRKSPNEISILTIGPLSNIARAFLKDPELPSLIKQIIIMGGAINVPGNKNRVAEFNMFVDPEAADIVFKAGVKKVLVPLDPCNEVILQLSDFEKLKGSVLYKPVMGLMEHFIQGIEDDEGTKGALVYDALAAYYLVNPGACQTIKMDVVMETKGEHTFGMTVAEKRHVKVMNTNMEVVTHVDKKQFTKDLFNILNS